MSLLTVLSVVQAKQLTFAGLAVMLLTGCGTTKPHDGRIPFRWTERAPTPTSTTETLGFDKIASFDATSAEAEEDTEAAEKIQRQFDERIASLRPGDVIAFVMSHEEAWTHLRSGRIQKLPYDLLRYGHLAIVVPGPTNLSTKVGDLRLLQVALLQPVSAAEPAIDYLRDKSWEIHRPPDGRVDPARLRMFAHVASKRGSSWRSYDVTGMLGLNNAKTDPETIAEIDHEYSCATLVVAALHYSGFELDAVHRGGWLDVVSPRQIVESHARTL